MIKFIYNVITGLTHWEFKAPPSFKEDKRGIVPPPKDTRNQRERQGFKRRY